MKKILLISLITSSVFSQTSNIFEPIDLLEIYSLDQMDDQRGYCIDIKGHKSKAKVNSGLQAHTCYSYQGADRCRSRFR